MNDSIGFYSEVARAGAEILEVLSGSSRTKDDVKAYLDRIAKIYCLLSQVHNEVELDADKAKMATTLDEARQYLQGMELRLRLTFRAQEWCYQFKDHG